MSALGTGGHGFNRGPQHIRVIKMVLAAPRLCTQTYRIELDWSTQCQCNVTGSGIVSGVWGMILLSGSTIKVSIELPVATRHRRDMTGTRTHSL